MSSSEPQSLGPSVVIALIAGFLFVSPFALWWADRQPPWYTPFTLWLLVTVLTAWAARRRSGR